MSENNVAKIKPPAPPKMLSPAQLIEKAVMSGAGIEIIHQLLEAEKDVSKTLAIRAFNSAIAEFKKSPPAILKNVEVSYGGGRTSYKHEDLAEIMAVLDPALAAHGLWARWMIDSDINRVTVTCVIGHADGYSEANCKLSAAPDTSGSKNPIQAIGSAVTYLQRCTLKAALGLAAAKDTDAADTGSLYISNEQAGQIEECQGGLAV